MISARKLAGELGINERTFRNYIRRGLVKAVKVGNRWVVPSNEAERVRMAVRLARETLPLGYLSMVLRFSREELEELDRSLMRI